MDVWDIVWAVYGIVAGLSIMATYREQLRNGHRVVLQRAAGLLACVAWPVIFPVVFVAALVKST